MPFVGSVLAVAAVLAAAALAGWVASAALLPSGRPFHCERLAWGFATGLLLLALAVPASLVFGVSPRIGAPAFAVLAVAASYRFRVAGSGSNGAPAELVPRNSKLGTLVSFVFVALCALGLAVYALEALTEPMWSLDFLAIWGLKGKTIFALRGLPDRLFRDPELAFSHPEYPLGLPLLYAALAFALGRWDDQAMALLFPAIQWATLLALFGWLRRRGVSGTVALGATALLSLFSPLYSAFHTGLADIPLSFAALLLGMAVSDSIDGADSGAVRRLALSSLLAVGLKNEGLLLVVVSLGLVGASPRGARRGRVAAALLASAALVLVAHRLVTGGAALRDFDPGFLWPTRWAALLSRLGEALAVAAHEVALSTWPGLLAAAALFLAGRRTAFADRLLVLAASATAVYLFLPALAVLPGHPELGPPWLVRTALARTGSALAPLVAAGLAGRLGSAGRPS